MGVNSETTATTKMEVNVDVDSTNGQSDKQPTVTVESQSMDRDEAFLAQFGKKQRLKRRFGLISAIGLTSTIMTTWESITATLLNGLENGGPAGLIYSFLFVWAGSILQTLVMGELASMIPLAGGAFNWVAILAPANCRKFLSYLAGWLSVITYLGLASSACYAVGTLIQGLFILNYPNYVFERWHGTLLYWAVVALCVFVNTSIGRFLPQIESAILFLHILGFFIVLITMLSLAPTFQPAGDVFGTFLNEGGFSTNFLAVLVGMLTSTNSFPAGDAADHLAEEIHDASRNIPIAIWTSTLLDGCLGFGMLLALLFCQPDDVQATLNSDTLYPFMNIFAYATRSNAVATFLAALITTGLAFGAIAMTAASSRMIWAFAREGGLPLSRYLSRVTEKNRIPVWAVIATAVIAALLALINIGSTIGFDALISLVVSGYYSSFLLAAGVMLHKRLTTPESEIRWGWFKMGRFGVPVTILAIMYTLIGFVFSFFPDVMNPTIQEMNYCLLVFGAALIFSAVFWFTHGRKRYTGPIMELNN